MQNSILIVEDDFDLRENLVDILTEKLFKVFSAADGKESIKILNKEIPDLIISDIMMPVMDGYELLEFVRNSKDHKNTPFIFLSAKSSYQDVRKGMNKGADDYLPKPFSINELLEVVETRLKKREYIKEQLNEIKESIALSVPHELRTPLTPILGYSEIMVEEAYSLKGEEIKEIGSKISSSANRLRKCVDKFILFASILYELNGLDKKKNYLVNTVSEIESLISLIAKEYKIKSGVVDFQLKVQEGQLKIDESYLMICIRELVENACKFSPPDRKIKIVGKKKAKLYDLSFENSGTGLSNNQIKKITLFNKQFDKSFAGSGLGIPIVKKIISSFGGEFRIVSRPEKYTRVIIRIPLALENSTMC